MEDLLLKKSRKVILEFCYLRKDMSRMVAMLLALDKNGLKSGSGELMKMSEYMVQGVGLRCCVSGCFCAWLSFRGSNKTQNSQYTKVRRNTVWP